MMLLLQVATCKQIKLALYSIKVVLGFKNVIKFKLSHLSITSFKLSNHALLIKTALDVTIEDVVITGSAIIIQCLHCNAVKMINMMFKGSVLVIAWPELRWPRRVMSITNFQF